MSLSAIPVAGSFTSTGDSPCSVPVEDSHLLGKHPKSELTYDPSIDLNVSLNVSINSNCSTAYSNSTTASSRKIKQKHNCCEKDAVNAIYHSCHLGDRCDHRKYIDSASSGGASLEKCHGPAEFEEQNPVFDTEDTKQLKLGISNDSNYAQKDDANGHRETCRLLMRGRGCVDRTSSLPKLDGTRSECSEGEFSRTSSVRLPRGRDNSRVFRPTDLTTGELLGKGSFGQAFKVTHRLTGEVFVLKELYRVDEAAQKAFLKEVALLRSVAHPNVLQFCGVVYREGRLHLITEFIGGGSLQATIRDSTPQTLPYSRRVAFARDIAAGMDYLHGRGIIHRDLNSHNCLVRENDSVVVADFGLARILREPNWSVERKKFAKSTVGGPDAPTRGSSPASGWKKQGRKKRYTVVGNPYWMAPEMITGSKYDEKVDIFSFGIILCELISRIDADPDVMPRLNNFGLNVFEFRAQFCHECPEAFWRLAFLCCSLDPDRRPPFGDSRRWLDGLVLDAVRGVAPSEGLLLELEGYGEGDRSDSSSPDCGGSSEASTPDTTPSSRPVSSGMPLMRTISETLPPRSPRPGATKNSAQQDSREGSPQADQFRDGHSRQRDQSTGEAQWTGTILLPVISSASAVAVSSSRGSLDHVGETFQCTKNASSEAVFECETKDLSSTKQLSVSGESSVVECRCAKLGESGNLSCRKCHDCTNSWSTNMSQNMGSEADVSDISDVEPADVQSINTSLSATVEGGSPTNCWQHSPGKARPDLAKSTAINSSLSCDDIEGAIDQSYPCKSHGRKNCACSSEGAATCDQCLRDVSCREERTVDEEAPAKTSHLKGGSRAVDCNGPLLLRKRSSSNDKESPAGVTSSSEIFGDFYPPRHLNLSSAASSSDASTVILSTDYQCPPSSPNMICTDVVNSQDAHSLSYSKYKPVYKLYSASIMNSTPTTGVGTTISSETSGNNSLPVTFSCLSTNDAEGQVVSSIDHIKGVCSSQVCARNGSPLNGASQTPFLKSSSVDCSPSCNDNDSKNSNTKRHLCSLGGSRSKQSSEGRSRSRALRASRTLTQSNLWGLERFANGHLACSGGKSYSSSVPGTGGGLTASAGDNAVEAAANSIASDASPDDSSCRSLPLISAKQQPNNFLKANCCHSVSSSSGAIDSSTSENTGLRNGQALHPIDPTSSCANKSDSYCRLRSTAIHCNSPIELKSSSTIIHATSAQTTNNNTRPTIAATTAGR